MYFWCTKAVTCFNSLVIVSSIIVNNNLLATDIFIPSQKVRREHFPPKQIIFSTNSFCHHKYYNIWQVIINKRDLPSNKLVFPTTFCSRRKSFVANNNFFVVRNSWHIKHAIFCLWISNMHANEILSNIQITYCFSFVWWCIKQYISDFSMLAIVIIILYMFNELCSSYTRCNFKQCYITQ